MSSVKSSEFILGLPEANNLPTFDFPEIAFIGRSNSGKSSLINRLTGRKNLAHTSSTPGKTKEINFYKLIFQDNFQLICADLPGYGYAKLSHEFRQNVKEIIYKYISFRDSLKVVCLLIDCNRDPENEELDLREMLAEADRHLLILPTKIDRLNQKEKNIRIPRIAKLFNLEVPDLILSGKDISGEQIWKRILPLLKS